LPKYTNNIIISCGSNSWGGLEMITLETAILLSKTNNVILVSSKDSRLKIEALNNNLNIADILEKNLSSVSKLKTLIKDFKPDIIHTHLSHDLWTIVPALKIAKSEAKLFLTKHMGSGVSKKDLFHRYLYKRVNGVFAVSNYIRESVIETCPLNPEKVSVLHDGIIPDKFDKSLYNISEIKKNLNIPIDKLVIGIIGRISTGKGHKQFLEAAKIIKDKTSPGSLKEREPFFLVVGSSGKGEENYEIEIIEMARSLGLSNDTIFTGFRKNIPEMLAIIDILVFPSHLESFGITLLEAMAMEVPVAASNNAGILDIVIDGETGFLVPVKNSSILADAIIKLIENPELRKYFGTQGRKRVLQNFDMRVIVDKLVENYKKL